jgi:vancomycin resistance protein YoaR
VNGRRRPRPPTRRRQLTAATAILVVGLVLLALAVRVTHSGQILPGVRVEGVGLGGLSEAQARLRLASLAREVAGESLALHARGRRLTISPAQAGYAVDIQATIARAMSSGRGGPLGGLWTTVAGLVRHRDVALVEAVDRRRLEATVASLVDRLGSSSLAGELAIEPGTLAVSTTPPRSGSEVDRQTLAARLAVALTRHPRGTVEVPLRTRRVASRAAVDAVGRAARDYLRAPLRLTGSGASLAVSPDALAGVLALEPSEGGSVRLGAAGVALAALVDRLAAARDRPARDAQVDAPARVVTLDAKGDASWRPRPAHVRVTQQARSGRTVDRAQLATAIEAAIRAGRHAIELPTQHDEPAISADAARRMDALIGTFTTYYVPGQPRVTNIRRIARDVDGTIVAPGARFSLNATVGERTTAGGYVKAPFIADGRLEDSIGGGVSQFSTTLYNAAYFAGLQIDAHLPHSFFIDRYPVGREATLNFPDIDMTWTNDTRAPVLIRTSTDAGSVAVSLYGDNGGRRVSARSGERMPTDGGDFAITVTRVVRYGDGRVVRQPFTTRYDKPPTGE